MPTLHEFQTEQDAVDYLIEQGYAIGFPPLDEFGIRRMTIYIPGNYHSLQNRDKSSRATNFLKNLHLYRVNASHYVEEAIKIGVFWLGMRTLRTKERTYE